MRQLGVLAALLAALHCQLATFPIKLGKTFRVSMTDAGTWGRTLLNGQQQILRSCDEGDAGEECTHWSNLDGEVVHDSSVSRAFQNGTLLIQSVSANDLGTYYCPELSITLVRLGGNKFVAIGGPQIDLVEDMSF